MNHLLERIRSSFSLDDPETRFFRWAERAVILLTASMLTGRLLFRWDADEWHIVVGMGGLLALGCVRAPATLRSALPFAIEARLVRDARWEVRARRAACKTRFGAQA